MTSTSPNKRLLIGVHPSIEKILSICERVGPTDSTVLIAGESGTGKELIARYLHTCSKRANNPFIAVSCAAIPSTLLESEMFGHEKGAFTGAIGARVGLFQLSNGGTIFLDEIGEMNLALQVKLLRVLQEREIRAVGSEKTTRVDIRVVAASNRNLAAEVEQGRFREDLFYRLQVIPITVPPLRERRSDIPLLVQHFLDRHNEQRPHAPVRIDDDAMVYLWEYDWPGNVRELENMVERLVILSEDGAIHVDNLPPNIRAFISDKKIPRPVLTDDGVDLNQAVEDFEFRLIDEALRRTKGNKQAAAKLLGLKRTTLVAKLRRRPESQDSDPGYLL